MTGSSSTVVRGDEAAWRALPTPGVSTFLLRFAAGAHFPAHNHPGGEQVFVLEGDLQIGRERLRAGDYLYTPPNGKHAVSTEAGCLLLAPGYYAKADRDPQDGSFVNIREDPYHGSSVNLPGNPHPDPLPREGEGVCAATLSPAEGKRVG